MADLEAVPVINITRLLTSGARDFHAYTTRDFSDSHHYVLTSAKRNNG